MRNGIAFERPTSAPLIAESVCSSSPSRVGEVLPTPTVSEANGADNNTGTGEKNLRTLIRDEIVLPTPSVTNGHGNGANGRGEPLLPGVAEQISDDVVFPTPTVGDAGTGRAHRGGGLTLLGAVEGFRPGDAERFGRHEPGLLPTPVVSDSESARRHTTRSDGASHAGTSLGDAVDALLPTPTTQETHSGPSQAGRNTRPLNDQVLDFLPTPIVSDSRGGVDDPIGRGAMIQLRDIDHLLPTPDVSSSKRSAEAHASGEHQVTLHDLPHLLPTPVAMEGYKGTSLSPEHRIAGGHQVWLSNIAPTFNEPDDVDDPLLPTPTARDHKDSGGMTPHPEKRKLAHTIAGEDIELLPTPAASVVNDGESAESWQARHDHHASKGDDATRSGMPLPVAVQGVNWGKYGPAIERAAQIAGRPAPAPTLPDGRDEKHRLASRFVEWMMLLPDGHVTGHGLPRSKELARLGNGVVPLQAAASVAVLIGRLAADKRSEVGP